MILKENQVVCNKCNKVMTVANPNGLRSGHCVCGICHSRLEVNFWVEDHVIETSVDKKEGMATSLPAIGEVTEYQAFLVINDNEYALSIGNNIVGRWSPTTQSDVQLIVNDEYLSRQHVLVNVYRQTDGKLRITVKNYKNTNETLVNDNSLEHDTLVVNEGDTIKMADTMAKVVIKPVNGSVRTKRTVKEYNPIIHKSILND